MKVLITGGTGYIGSHILLELLDGFDVLAIESENGVRYDFM
jgi:nucleoside-diphosphate-sugar epimerase